MDIINTYKFCLIPFLLWLAIQIFKIFDDLIRTRKFNFKRIMGAGGMPSSHSAVVTSLATLIGMSEGFESPAFGIALVLALIVMYDAAGVRRAAGKQAVILNKIINTPGITTMQVNEKLQEFLGHTPVQVVVGAVIGIVVGIIFG